MTLPNFIILGAAKSGTTALYHYLKQHPDIYMSPLKETEFFAFEGEKLSFRGPGDMPRNTITELGAYKEQFASVSKEIAVGEASPVYLFSSKAPHRIFHYLPEAKLITILRNPVERAYSQFLMFIRDGREPLLDFAEALAQEKERAQNHWAWGWQYKKLGFYYEQLNRYYQIFDANQIKVYLYEDLKSNPRSLFTDIFDFIGVDKSFVPNISTRHNISGIPKNKLIHDFVRKPNLLKSSLKPLLPSRVRKKMIGKLHDSNLDKPQLTEEVKQEMVESYREDILKLQDLTCRDLSHWLV